MNPEAAVNRVQYLCSSHMAKVRDYPESSQTQSKKLRPLFGYLQKKSNPLKARRKPQRHSLLLNLQRFSLTANSVIQGSMTRGTTGNYQTGAIAGEQVRAFTPLALPPLPPLKMAGNARAA